MSLNSADFLTTLINSGADASLNLYTVTFQPLEGDDITTVKEQFSCRITQLPNLLQRDNTTSEVGYQNVSIPVINTGSSMNRSLGFSIRIDEDYYIWKKLRELQCIDTFGNIVEDNKKKINITLSALKADNCAVSSDNYYTIYEWKFYDCFITSVSPINYNYDNASTATTSVNFIWRYYEENAVDEITPIYDAYNNEANRRGRELTEKIKAQQIKNTKDRDDEKGRELTKKYQYLITASADNKKGIALTNKLKANMQSTSEETSITTSQTTEITTTTESPVVATPSVIESLSTEVTANTTDTWQVNAQSKSTADRDNVKGQYLTEKLTYQNVKNTIDRDQEKGKALTNKITSQQNLAKAQATISRDNEKGKTLTEKLKAQQSTITVESISQTTNPEVVKGLKSTEELLEEKKLSKKQSIANNSFTISPTSSAEEIVQQLTTPVEVPVMETVSQTANSTTSATSSKEGLHEGIANAIANAVKTAMDTTSAKTTTTQETEKSTPIQNTLLSGLLAGDSLSMRLNEDLKAKKEVSAPEFAESGKGTVTETTTRLSQAVESGVTDGKDLAFALLADSLETQSDLKKALTTRESLAVKSAPKANKPLVNDSATYDITTKINGESPVMSAIKSLNSEDN